MTSHHELAFERDTETAEEYRKTCREGHRPSQAEAAAHEYLDKYYATHPLMID